MRSLVLLLALCPAPTAAMPTSVPAPSAAGPTGAPPCPVSAAHDPPYSKPLGTPALLGDPAGSAACAAAAGCRSKRTVTFSVPRILACEFQLWGMS